MGIRDRFAERLALPVRIPADAVTGRSLRLAVDGFPLRIDCAEANLTAGPEALGSTFLVPAGLRGRSIAGRAADGVWQAGARRAFDLAGRWWGWKGKAPRFRATLGPGRPAAGVGLPFSLGVDSFYSCFFAEPRPDLLVLAAGFDVPLRRDDIMSAMRASVAEVARVTGKDWACVETNLRDHPLFRRTNWGYTHGGALALLGHLLRDRIGTLQIAGSFDVDTLDPWGSHPDLDPLWSSSGLAVRHQGLELNRLEKLRKLLSHPVAAPLVQQHLRVCWRAPRPEGNCGQCNKCVNLRLALHRVAPGLRLATMPDDVPLAEAIRGLPPVQIRLFRWFWTQLAAGDGAPLDEALHDLLRRSDTAFPG